jgi:hypothetical protein
MFYGIIANMAKYNKENIQEAARVSHSLSDMARHFGIKPTGGTLGWYRKLIERFQIDVSHFTGYAHMKGKVSSQRKSAKEILRKTGKMQHGWKLRRSLLEIGRKDECQCGQASLWNGKSLILIVDHINGDNTDHRPDNLRILCPNCHSQTDTFAGRNKR